VTYAPVHRLEEVDSTQRVARELAIQGAPHGTAVRAERQTRGRGRLDRVWESAPGLDLTWSVVLRPTCRLREAPLLTLGAAAALAELLDVRVKWPNDLVDDDGRKLAGLLAEVDADGDRVRWVVLGIGLNVNQLDPPPAHLPHATSLARLRGVTHDREGVFAQAHAAVVSGVEHPARLTRWRERAHTLGRHVVIGEASGIATELRDDGALRVGERWVTTGEIGA
jgi:BirA family biotin operon repressor/biotin-[acetyl-CoA-carboxylase] ligase